MSGTTAAPGTFFTSPAAVLEYEWLLDWPGRAIDRVRRDIRRMWEQLRRGRDATYEDRAERRRAERLAADVLLHYGAALQSYRPPHAIV